MINFYSVEDICNANKKNRNLHKGLNLGFLLENNYMQIELINSYNTCYNGQMLYAFTRDYILNLDLDDKVSKNDRILGLISDIDDSSIEINVAGQAPISITTEYSWSEIMADKDMMFILLNNGQLIGIPSKFINKKWQIYQKSPKKKTKEKIYKIKNASFVGLTIFALYMLVNRHKS